MTGELDVLVEPLNPRRRRIEISEELPLLCYSTPKRGVPSKLNPITPPRLPEPMQEAT